jgi:hypothetical protein
VGQELLDKEIMVVLEAILEVVIIMDLVLVVEVLEVLVEMLLEELLVLVDLGKQVQLAVH